MSKIIEDMIREDKREIAIRMIKDGTVSLEKIAEYLGFTLEEVEKIVLKETEKIGAQSCR